jgi:cysteine-rich repeat protein
VGWTPNALRFQGVAVATAARQNAVRRSIDGNTGSSRIAHFVVAAAVVSFGDSIHMGGVRPVILWKRFTNAIARRNRSFSIIGSILGLVALAPVTAHSQVPTLLGFYEGSSTNTVSGCFTPQNNRTTIGSGFVDITEQVVDSFGGDADFSASVEGSTVREVLTLDGFVGSSGEFNGSADSEAFVNGIPAGSGSASFTGSVNGNQLSIQFPGGPLGIDNCSQSGALIEVATSCGNGDIDLGEECDDGNRQPSDGCSEFCIVVPEPEADASALVAFASILMLVARDRRRDAMSAARRFAQPD